MKIKVIGKSHLQGTSKKTNRLYDFIQVHYNGKAFCGALLSEANFSPEYFEYFEKDRESMAEKDPLSGVLKVFKPALRRSCGVR